MQKHRQTGIRNAWLRGLVYDVADAYLHTTCGNKLVGDGCPRCHVMFAATPPPNVPSAIVPVSRPRRLRKARGKKPVQARVPEPPTVPVAAQLSQAARDLPFAFPSRTVPA